MVVTEAGMVIVSIPLPENTSFSIVVTLPGNDTLVIPMQSDRAPEAIVVVPAAMDKDVRPSGTNNKRVEDALYKHPSVEE